MSWVVSSASERDRLVVLGWRRSVSAVLLFLRALCLRHALLFAGLRDGGELVALPHTLHLPRLEGAEGLGPGEGDGGPLDGVLGRRVSLDIQRNFNLTNSHTKQYILIDEKDLCLRHMENLKAFIYGKLYK